MQTKERQKLDDEEGARDLRNGCLIAVGGIFVALCVIAGAYYGLAKAALWFLKQVHDIYK